MFPKWPKRGSNPHVPNGTRDFKSRASANRTFGLRREVYASCDSSTILPASARGPTDVVSHARSSMSARTVLRCRQDTPASPPFVSPCPERSHDRRGTQAKQREATRGHTGDRQGRPALPARETEGKRTGGSGAGPPATHTRRRPARMSKTRKRLVKPSCRALFGCARSAKRLEAPPRKTGETLRQGTIPATPGTLATARGKPHQDSPPSQRKRGFSQMSNACIHNEALGGLARAKTHPEFPAFGPQD